MPARATKTRSTRSRTHSADTKRRTATRSRSSASHRSSHGRRKWSASVNTESTYPQEGLFKKDAETIARSLASKRTSPKGPSSGMRMLTFYINRAGKNLSAGRRRVLERAKQLLHERIERTKHGAGTRSRSTRQSGRRRSH
jgi:hypothetical protein